VRRPYYCTVTHGWTCPSAFSAVGVSGRIAAVDRSRPAGGLRRSSTARPGGWRSTSRWQGTCDSRVWTRSRSVTATPPVPFRSTRWSSTTAVVVGRLLVVVLDFEREAAALAGGEVRRVAGGDVVAVRRLSDERDAGVGLALGRARQPERRGSPTASRTVTAGRR